MNDKEAAIAILKAKADPKNREAIAVLEARGFKFCVHFGYANAADVLRGMDRAMALGCLYEWAKGRLGMEL